MSIMKHFVFPRPLTFLQCVQTTTQTFDPSLLAILPFNAILLSMTQLPYRSKASSLH